MTEDKCYCTRAITGSYPCFQSIYICRSCCSEDNLSCFCQGCADTCHADHDGLDCVGIGPSYCDCNDIGNCVIYKSSKERAESLGAVQRTVKEPASRYPKAQKDSQTYYWETFSIPYLQDETLCKYLCEEAKALVKKSKETFWLQRLPDEACGLEQLAWNIFLCQIEHQKLKASDVAGIEWWVQVKYVTPVKDDCVDDIQPTTRQEEAVDMHFDKDEVLAEEFGLGSFPYLSTVTYLSDSIDAPPTVVFSRIFSDEEDYPMKEMLVSYPARGKHLTFDGRLLHGAPAHQSLRACGKKEGERPRITFLVNIWYESQPLGVTELSDDVRQQLLSKPGRLLPMNSDPFLSAAISRISLSGDSGAKRIILPFLGAGTTWNSVVDEEEDDDVTTATVVSTLVPCEPPANDSFAVDFNDGSEAFLDYK